MQRLKSPLIIVSFHTQTSRGCFRADGSDASSCFQLLPAASSCFQLLPAAGPSAACMDLCLEARLAVVLAFLARLCPYYYQTHLQFQATQPHFATCSFASLHAARGKVTDTELSMLRSRMKLYVFQKRLEEVRDIPCCVNCFAMWILSAGGNVAKFLAKGFPAVDG